jgi:hypothetical protein
MASLGSQGTGEAATQSNEIKWSRNSSERTGVSWPTFPHASPQTLLLKSHGTVDIYGSPSQAVIDGDTAADDRIAEEFQREFMDAMAERQKRRRAPPQTGKQGSKAKDEDVLKGPKLGGSRNQRAAMRDILLKQQESKR